MANSNYDPYKVINKIYNLKGEWATANQNGDDNKKNDIAKQAEQYYQSLREMGYGNVANQLQATDYNGAKAINDKYAQTGKNAIRPYLYNSKLSTEYGLSNADIDKNISFNNLTGEVSLGGKNIGTPYSIVDGVSYWDSAKLDAEIEDFVKRKNLLKSDDRLQTEYNNQTQNNINELWGYQSNDKTKQTQNYQDFLNYIYSNPFETDEGKAIMSMYGMKGTQAGENAVASNAGSSGGNIDSYALATANRQKLAYQNQGKQAVIDNFNNRIANIQNALSGLGTYQQNQDKGMQTTIGLQQTENQRLFENKQTAQNNEINNQVKLGEHTGKVTDTATYLANSNIWNADGTLKNANIDFQAQINDLETTLKSTTDTNERARITEQLRLLEAARNQKIDEQGLTYGKTYKYQGAPETYTAQKDKADRESAERITAANNANAIEQIKTSAEYSKGGDEYAAYNVLLSMWPVNETEKRAFIEEFIKPVYEGKETITPEGLKQLIITNSEKYNIDVDDAQKICQAFDVSTDWLNQYRDRTDADGITTEGRTGNYGGMVKK